MTAHPPVRDGWGACQHGNGFPCPICVGVSIPATIPPVSPRARGDLTPQQAKALDKIKADHAKAEAAYREGILSLMDAGVSYTAIRAATGHSTSTLREWKVASGRA